MSNALFAVEHSDPPIQHGAWTLAWSGWRSSFNQMVVFGFWEARRGDEHHYSTTMGVCEETRTFYALDISWREGWPRLTMASSLSECEHAKLMALDALTTHLQNAAGTP